MENRMQVATTAGSQAEFWKRGQLKRTMESRA